VLDDVLMRICDIKLALPGILFISLFITGFGESLGVLIALIGLVYFPGVIRIVRAQALTQVNLGYVKAAQLRGERARPRSSGARSCPTRSTWSTWSSPSACRMRSCCSPPCRTWDSGLSPPTPDWGLMVSEGVGQISFAPWLVLFPAVFISTLVIGLNFGAEALANALGMDAARGYVGSV
jgi:peptide/nickel transport system permease protein